LSHRQLLEKDIPVAKILGGFVAERTITMVYAARGRGKTRFSLGLACAVASGTKFLSWDAPEQPSGVLYIDGEMPLRGLQDIMRRITPMPIDDLYFLASEHFYAQCEHELQLTQEVGRNLIDRALESMPQIKMVGWLQCAMVGKKRLTP
jgi:hypothetical protein